MQKRQIEAPLLDALTQRIQKRNRSFHFPGHKNGGAVFPKFRQLIGTQTLQLDLTELEGLDNLVIPEGVIKESQEMTAEIFGADRSFYLVNGTTVGILAAILATSNSNTVCIMSRNCHKSTYNAIALAGCGVQYLIPEFDEQRGICHGLHPAQVLERIKRVKADGHQVGCVCVLSSTYFGVVHDLKRVAEVCHEFDVPLVVDDAHGGHFAFHDDLPLDALSCGADVVIQSTHKVLSSLTQSSILHVKSSLVDSNKIFEYLKILQSSSPSYLLMASLEAAVLHAEHCWDIEGAIEIAKSTVESLQEVRGVVILSKIEDLKLRYQFDIFRICVILEEWNITAEQTARLLERDFSVVPEMTTNNIIVFALGPGTEPNDTIQLISAMHTLSEEHFSGIPSSVPTIMKPEIPLMKLTPFEAMRAEKIKVPFNESLGEICGETIASYPPGIPIIASGEVITESIHKTLQTRNPPYQFINVIKSSASHSHH